MGLAREPDSLQDVVAEDYVADLDPTVKPLYGHQEGADEDYADGYEWYARSFDAHVRPLLQSYIVRLSRHARQGIVTIYTATSGKARKIYRAISAFLSGISSASKLSVEERRKRLSGGIISASPPSNLADGQMTP